MTLQYSKNHATLGNFSDQDGPRIVKRYKDDDDHLSDDHISSGSSLFNSFLLPGSRITKIKSKKDKKPQNRKSHQANGIEWADREEGSNLAQRVSHEHI